MSDGREGEGEVSQPMSDHNLPGTCVCVFIYSLNGLTTAWVKGQHPWWSPWESEGPHLLGQGFTAQGNFLLTGQVHQHISWSLLPTQIKHSLAGSFHPIGRDFVLVDRGGTTTMLSGYMHNGRVVPEGLELRFKG
jgi:hypothetical protein